MSSSGGAVEGQEDDELAAFEAEIDALAEEKDGAKLVAASRSSTKESKKKSEKRKRSEAVIAAAQPVLSADVAKALKQESKRAEQSSSFLERDLDEDEPKPAGWHGKEDKKTEETSKKFVRSAGGKVWVDHTLNEWPENDFRLWVGGLGKDVTDEMLTERFNQYSTFNKAKVIRLKSSGESKGYGFVSFMDPMVMVKAMREQNTKFLGSRRMQIKRGKQEQRDIKHVRKEGENRKKRLKQLGLA